MDLFITENLKSCFQNYFLAPILNLCKIYFLVYVTSRQQYLKSTFALGITLNV